MNKFINTRNIFLLLVFIIFIVLFFNLILDTDKVLLPCGWGPYGLYGLSMIFFTIPITIFFALIIFILFIFIGISIVRKNKTIYIIICLVLIIITRNILIETVPAYFTSSNCPSNYKPCKIQKNIITGKMGCKCLYYNNEKSIFRSAFKIPSKYKDIKLIRTNRKYFCPYFIVKTDKNERYIDKKNKFLFSQYDDSEFIDRHTSIYNGIVYFEYPYKEYEFKVKKNDKYGIYLLDVKDCNKKVLAVPIEYDEIITDNIRVELKIPLGSEGSYTVGEKMKYQLIIANKNNLTDVYIKHVFKDGNEENSEYKLAYKNLQNFAIIEKVESSENEKVAIKNINKDTVKIGLKVIANNKKEYLGDVVAEHSMNDALNLQSSSVFHIDK